MIRQPVLSNPELIDEAKAFRDWLKQNHNHLRAYAPDQIALLALTCGFNGTSMYSGICDNVIRLKNLMTFWESPLSEHWLDVTSFQRGMSEWSE